MGWISASNQKLTVANGIKQGALLLRLANPYPRQDLPGSHGHLFLLALGQTGWFRGIRSPEP